METSHKHPYKTKLDPSFKMSLRTGTETIRAGEPVKLYFKPELVSKPDYIVPLSFLHEKKIHLIIVSKNLSYFSHNHPELSESGEYMWEHTFPSEGHYILFQDYMPQGADHQLGKQEIYVAGNRTSQRLTEKIATAWEGGYEVKIYPENQLIESNVPVTLKAEVTKDGKPITDLEKYLGSLAHVVIINEETLDYLHVHPMESKTRGPEIMLHTTFPRNGYYKIFMEFQHEGHVRLADFVLAA